MRELIERHGGRVLPFRALPLAHQMAIAQYCSIAGVSWNAPLELWSWISRHKGKRAPLAEELARHMHYYVQEHGEQRFGVVDLPTAELLPRIMEGYQLAPFRGEWSAYHAWYTSFGSTPDHDVTRPLWPVWLAIDHRDREALEDGWHRLHDYVRKGLQLIPGVYTPFSHEWRGEPARSRATESMALA
jgi:hypothetical protein